ncbi:MAG TPA: zf-HC2 domain-containing protein [Casimicrobiaceae bacterium]|nr:zf-HC2 domain-containing protein [Casimicrobiaceae bacterium]
MNLLSRALGHLVSCREVTRLVSQLHERPPTRFEGLRLRLHLAACEACATFDRQMTLLHEAMRRYRD